MRKAALVGLLLWGPPLASAQQDQVIVDRVLGNVSSIAVFETDTELPPGTIAVEVVDEAGEPVPQAAVRLGVMEQSGGRQSEACVTNDEGRCLFEELATDSAHSYRVNVPYDGARYSSTPFRLDSKAGQRVRINRLPTTTNDQRVFQVLGRTMVEFKDDRAHVTQEVRLTNLGDATYVFPDGGLTIRLPEGAKAFDSRPMMTDQRVSRTDEGLEISGSLPPGRATLTWEYDVPFEGSTLTLEQAVPFRTMEYQVISDHIDGMTLEVEGFLVARIHEGADRRFLVAGLMRRPGDPRIDPLRIHIRGIPGGGPLPHLAVALAFVFLVLGLIFVFRPSDESQVLAKARTERRKELLDEIAALEAERKADRIGPTFYEHRRRELTDELAILLRMQSEAEGH
ncbi:MAG: carboxypeptidase-like regulatory domain-containing protein [Deltaproteobacteria bacterium]|nr:carboxypeptidase-like regulatory domain-containing protein [Deltaproteobacteria bacterium]